MRSVNALLSSMVGLAAASAVSTAAIVTTVAQSPSLLDPASKETLAGRIAEAISTPTLVQAIGTQTQTHGVPSCEKPAGAELPLLAEKTPLDAVNDFTTSLGNLLDLDSSASLDDLKCCKHRGKESAFAKCMMTNLCHRHPEGPSCKSFNFPPPKKPICCNRKEHKDDHKYAKCMQEVWCRQRPGDDDLCTEPWDPDGELVAKAVGVLGR